MTRDAQSRRGGRHLLNCRDCDWHDVVEGTLSQADVRKEQHDTAIRGGDPTHSVAWAPLPGLGGEPAL